MKKILFIGYGIDPSRKEAVSLNTSKLADKLKKFNNIFIVNIGYKKLHKENTKNFYKSMFSAVLHRNEILRKINKIISEEKVTHVHDAFVLPGSSLLFVEPLIKLNKNVKFIKEVHNNPGFSWTVSFESFIRFIMNRKSQLTRIINIYYFVISRSKEISSKYNLFHLPPSIKISKLVRRPHKGRIVRFCYLGHPLRKKGIKSIINTFSLISGDVKKNLEFNFAFSNLGNKKTLETILLKEAQKFKIKIKIYGEVKPSVFFRKNDVYILPLQDQFGATSIPNTILEAMEAGCLVITTKTPMVKQVVIHNKNGLLIHNSNSVEINNAIHQIFNNQVDIDKLTKKARAFVKQKFSENLLSNNLKKIYA